MTELACTCFRLRRAAREVSALYDRALAAVGLSTNEYSILKRALPAPRVLGDLAAELGMDRSTLTRNIAPLTKAGLLCVARGEDARQRVLTVTAKGRQRVDRAVPLWREAQRRMQGILGDAQTQRLNDELDALHERLAAQAGVSP